MIGLIVGRDLQLSPGGATGSRKRGAAPTRVPGWGGRDKGEVAKWEERDLPSAGWNFPLHFTPP